MISMLVGVVLATPPSVPPPAPATQSVVQAPASVPVVTLRGRAHNAKLAAALVTPEGVVYLIEWPAWPDDQLGREVEVTGTLEVTDQFKAQVDAQGNHSQGTAGGDTLLRGATVKVLDPPTKSP